MGAVLGPEKMNDIYGKTMHMGIMDRSFTVFCKITYEMHLTH